MVIMVELAFAVLLVVIAFLIAFICFQRRDFRATERDLLNRIMAREYGQYVQAEISQETARRPLTDDEIAALQEERGIPVI